MLDINKSAVNNKSPIWHPMHLHGHNMFILVRPIPESKLFKVGYRAFQ
jgi:FtsP/CotA-like multicopper oxidase with cupredoxin domain